MMIAWNILRKREHGDKGLALGFGIPLGAMPANVLPGWAVAITPEAPSGVAFDDIQAARKGAGAFAPGIPLILFGLDAGAASVRAVILSHLTPPPWAVLAAGAVPAAGAWEGALVWEPLMERARGGLGMLTLAALGDSEWAGIVEGLGVPGPGVDLSTTAKGAPPPAPGDLLAALSKFATGPKAP